MKLQAALISLTCIVLCIVLLGLVLKTNDSSSINNSGQKTSTNLITPTDEVLKPSNTIHPTNSFIGSDSAKFNNLPTVIIPSQ